MSYIGHNPTNAGSFYILDDITLGNSAGPYNLTVAGVSVTPKIDNLLIALDGVLQHAEDAYTISGNQITFASAPGSGVDFYGVIMGQSASFAQGSIGADELKINGDGSSGQLLSTDGDGTFSYVNQSAVTADANVLSGTTLKSTVVNSSLTSVGTLTGLTTGAITQNAGVLTIKNASSDSNGLRIFQDSSDASKIYNNFNGTLQLGVGNTTALTIDSSENATFAGDVNVQSDGARFFVKSADYELVSIGRAGSSGSALDQGYIRMKNAGTNTIALHSASNSYLTNGLSIGTSSMNSNAVVHIRGGDSGQTSSSNNTQLTVENSGSAGIQLLTGTSSVGGIWVGDSNGSETGGKLYYSNSGDGWTFFNQGSVQSCDIGLSMVNLYNNDTGSAGSALKQLSLGTSDNTALDFTNSGTIAGAIISNSNNTDDSACGVVFTHRTGSSGISYVASRNEGADRSGLYFGTRGSDGVQLRMEIRNDGIMVSKKGLIFDGSAIGSGQTGVGSSGSGGDLLFYSGGTAHARLQSTGRFVIGTTSGNAKLHIHETTSGQELIFLNHSVTGANQTYIQFRHDGTQRGNIQVNDSNDQIVYNTTYSDKRLKQDFEEWDESILPAFKSLKPQLFNFKNSENKSGKTKGYIAQDNVEKFPEAYTTSKVLDDDDTEYYSFNPSGMVTYLMKAVQELSAQNDALETRIVELENA